MAEIPGYYTPDGAFHRLSAQMAKPSSVVRPKTFDEYTTYYQQLQALRETENIWRDEVDIRVETNGLPFFLIPFSDLHLGSQGVAYERVRQYMRFLKDYPVATILLGDLLDNFSPTLLPVGMLDDLSPPDEQMGMVRSFFKEYRDKIIASVSGNHDSGTRRSSGVDIFRYLTEDLGIPLLHGGGVVNLTVDNEKYKIMGFHRIVLFHSNFSPTHSGKRALEFAKTADVVICIDRDTEILTKDGWKSYKTIKKTDIPLTFNLKTEEVEEDNIFKIIKNKYHGKLLHFKCRGIDSLVTPSHRVIYKHYHWKYKKFGKWLTHEAKDIKSMVGSIFFPVSNLKTTTQKVDLTNVEIAMAGWLISDGHFRVGNGSITISQKNNQKAKKIRKLLKSYCKFTEYYHKERNDIDFYIPSEEGYRIRRKIVDEKNIPNWAFKLNNKQFAIFLNALIDGDGSWKNKGRSGCYYSSNEVLIDKLQLSLFFHGYSTSKKYRKGGFKNGCWELYLCKRNKHTLNLKRFPIKEVYYNDIIWSLQTKNTTLITRRNGMILITGNSGHHHRGGMEKLSHRDGKKPMIVSCGTFKTNDTFQKDQGRIVPIDVFYPVLAFFPQRHNIEAIEDLDTAKEMIDGMGAYYRQQAVGRLGAK